MTLMNAPVLSGETPWIANLRTQAFARLQTLGFPTFQHEAWRYLNVTPILNASYTDAAPVDATLFDVKTLQKHFLLGTSCRYVSINGHFAKQFSTPQSGNIFTSDLASVLTTKAKELESLIAPTLEKETNPFVVLNTTSFRDGFFISIPEDEASREPLHLLLASHGGDTDPLFHPRVIVTVGRNATLDLAISQVALGHGSSFMNAVVELHLGEGSTLNLTHIQPEADAATQFVTMKLKQGKASNVNLTVFAQGGKIVRHEYHFSLEGEGATYHLSGTSVLSKQSQVYHHVHTDHIAPHCFGRQLQKNILTGESRSEWNSLVYIHHGARLSDSEQLNRNIVLSEGAKAIARPQLKVFHEDVKANHGATVGGLDRHELFYLRSRGLNARTAYAVLLRGFVEEATQGVTSPSLAAKLEELTNQSLSELRS